MPGRARSWLDRKHAVSEVLARLASRRSGWNAADIRGEVEHLIARTNIVVDPVVRRELAEDLTGRTVAECVPLRHASAKTTLDVYGHLWPDKDEVSRGGVRRDRVAADGGNRDDRSVTSARPSVRTSAEPCGLTADRTRRVQLLVKLEAPDSGSSSAASTHTS